MFNLSKMSFVCLVMTMLLVSCGGKKNNVGNQMNDPAQLNRVNWQAIPGEYNPKIDITEFYTDGFEKIYFDMFGFNKDVEVIFSSDIPQGLGILKIYKVWAKRASWGSIKQDVKGRSLMIQNYGQYQCSIQIQNGNITNLEGGCYIRMQIFLPMGTEIEIYNIGKLITKRFIPMNTEELLEQIDRATWSQDKFQVIEEFLNSYNGTNKYPCLTTRQLGVVVDEFIINNEKFKALGKLHTFVTDRENLRKMIDDKFNYFDREQALRIVGLK